MMKTLPTELAEYLASSRVALAVAAPDGDTPLVFVNQKFCALTGFKPEEVVGRNCRFLQRDADNSEARQRIHDFFENDDQSSVRTDLVNFRKDGTAFVNLLYMSKLRDRAGVVRFFLASQFDLSRSRPDLLKEYDRKLSTTLKGLSPVLAEAGAVFDGSFMTLANSATMIAQAKLLLASVKDASQTS